jgi:5-methylcytosine-specific restriction endonuclease McrA
MSHKNPYARIAMQKHTKIYLEFHGYQVQEDVVCEICSQPAIDIHHITAKGMGGNPEADCIENLIGLCRACHDKAHAGEITEDELYETISFKEIE